MTMKCRGSTLPVVTVRVSVVVTKRVALQAVAGSERTTLLVWASWGVREDLVRSNAGWHGATNSQDRRARQTAN